MNQRAEEIEACHLSGRINLAVPGVFDFVVYRDIAPKWQSLELDDLQAVVLPSAEIDSVFPSVIHLSDRVGVVDICTTFVFVPVIATPIIAVFDFVLPFPPLGAIHDLSISGRPLVTLAQTPQSYGPRCQHPYTQNNGQNCVTRVLEEPVIRAGVAVYLGAIRLPIRVQNQHPVLVFPLNVLEECHTENTVFRIPCP